MQATYAKLSLLIALLAGCNNGESCSSIAGQWEIDGECGADVCTISQNGCATTFDCDTARGTTGTVSGSAVRWQGEAAGGVPGTCEGTVNGDRIQGTCTVAGEMCDFVAMRLGRGAMDAGDEREEDGGNIPPPRDSGGPDEPDSGPVIECVDFSGEWGVTGTCGADLCAIDQTGCSTSFDCDSNPESTSGSVTGNTATWRARTGKTEGTCTATITGDSFSGTCTLDIGASCTIMGTRLAR